MRDSKKSQVSKLASRGNSVLTQTSWTSKIAQFQDLMTAQRRKKSRPYTRKWWGSTAWSKISSTMNFLSLSFQQRMCRKTFQLPKCHQALKQGFHQISLKILTAFLISIFRTSHLKKLKNTIFSRLRWTTSFKREEAWWESQFLT